MLRLLSTAYAVQPQVDDIYATDDRKYQVQRVVCAAGCIACTMAAGADQASPAMLLDLARCSNMYGAIIPSGTAGAADALPPPPPPASGEVAGAPRARAKGWVTWKENGKIMLAERQAAPSSLEVGESDDEDCEITDVTHVSDRNKRPCASYCELCVCARACACVCICGNNRPTR